MIFTEGRFFVFFLVAFCVHWVLRGNTARKVWLLACSYVFYAAWDVRFLSLILLSTAIDYVVGRRLGVVQGARARKAWLGVSIVANLALLGFFKYYNFFVESASALLSWLGFGAHDATLRILLPVGISFYTFQTLSYSIDVYRRRLPPAASALDLALFVGFFPQLVAGPIVRAVHFLPLLRERRVFRRDVAVRACLSLFLFGFVKKACLADNVASVVDRVFAEPEAWNALSGWIALLLYSVQLYCDFSGYSDMAIATAGLLGYPLPENFDFPWFTRSVAEFWRKWHISLSGWMQDYVYFPLGGSRGSEARTIFNLYVTTTLIGLWHGAAWTFVLWGFQHATYVVVNRIWGRLPARSLPRRLTTRGGMLLTNLAVVLSFIPFRSTGMHDAWSFARLVMFLRPGGEASVGLAWLGLWAGCVAAHWITYRRFLHAPLRAMPHWLFAVVYGLAWGLALPWVASDYAPFIYFQF